MVTTKFYLDTRRKNEATHLLRINICHRQKTAAYSLGLKLQKNQWNPIEKAVINHPEAKYWTNFINRRKIEIDTLIMKLEDLDAKKLTLMTAVEIRDYVTRELTPEEALKPVQKPKEDPNTFLKWFDKFTNRKKGRTKGLYEATRSRLVAWCKGEENLASFKFEDIKISWLEDFEDFLSETNSANSIAIHLRNIRAVVNYAIDNEVTNFYAFRRYKIKTEKTRKRNFDVETLRRIFSHECEEEWQKKYLDFFKLTFMLIGINCVDLCRVRKIKNGRIEYIRSKTHRSYTIKVEKEAKEIIERYKGTELLLGFCEKYTDYRHFYNNLAKGLNAIKDQLGLDELTTYWARHSWATIARRIGIAKDIISLGLGHGNNTVTDIYIEEDTEPVDIANRKVLDYVLYGKGEKKRGRPKKDSKLIVKY